MIRTEYPSGTGSLRFLEFDSQLLQGNRYRDPTLRAHPVYLPPSYDEHPDRDYPVVLGLAGYTGTGMHFFGPGVFTETMQDRLDRLIAGGMPELIFVAVDCYNYLGGSQYLNGAAGPYEDYIVQELVPQIREDLRADTTRGIGVVGKSSGGFGALQWGMRHPELFTAVASHSGDAGFEHCVWPAVAQAIGVLDRFEGSEHEKIRQFLEHFHDAQQPSYDEGHCLMMLASAAAYTPDPDSPSGFVLPFDVETGERRDEIWERWLAVDPPRCVEQHADALKQLRLLFIDCGNRDQYGIQLGTRQLHQRLEAAGVPHEYEEFDGTHSGIQYRYDTSVPKIVAALKEGN